MVQYYNVKPELMLKALRRKQRLNVFLISTFVGCALIIHYLFVQVYFFILSLLYNSLSDSVYKFLMSDKVFNSVEYIFYAFLTIFSAFVLMRLPIKRISDFKMPYKKPGRGSHVFSVVVIALAMCAIGNYLTVIFSSFTDWIFNTVPTGNPSELEGFTEISFLSYVMSIISTAVIPAVVEEFSFRGVVMQPLRKYGDQFAVVVSACIFALVHGNFVQIPFAFVAGLALGYAVIRTESMWVGVLIHFLNNAWSVTSEYIFYITDYRLAYIIYYLTDVVIVTLGIIFAVWLYKRDIKNGMTEGVMMKSKESVLPIWQKTVSFFASPALWIGAYPFVLNALRCFE